MNKKSYSHILDAAALDIIPQDLDLAPQIIARVQKGKGVTMQSRIRFASAVLLALIAFVVLFYTVPGVAAAIGRWFGYVPGVGLVRDGQIRVLAEAAALTRDGVTVTVEQVLLDPERAVLVYSVEGMPAEAVTRLGDEVPCAYRVTLTLPDGTQLTASPNGIDSWPTGYQHRFIFPPVPVGVNEATLSISCLYDARPGALPEDWQIPLRFVPAPPDLTAFPVFEIATPTAEAAAAPASPEPADTEAAPGQAAPAATADEPAITLALDRAVQMDDGYLLYATLHWEDTPFETVDVFDTQEDLHLLDANGQEMLFEVIYDDQTGLKWDQRQTVIALKTAPLETAGPLTLKLDAVVVNMPVEASFVFDAGADPQPGQVWRIDQVLPFGERALNIHAARATQTGYTIEMSSDTGILYAIVADFDHPVVAGGGGGGGSMLGEKFEFGFNYADGPVPGPITVRVTALGVKLASDLQATWTPPAASSQLLPTQPAACLNTAAWKQAQAQTAPLPEGLGGKLLVSGPLEDKPGEYGVWTIRLDGTEKQVIPGAQDGMFSPDGTKLAYSTLQDGITILSLDSGQTTHLPNTVANDFNPTWSPDGTRIIFNRGSGIFDLFVINLDGTGLRQLTTSRGQEWFAGWLADGQMAYLLPGRIDEYTVYRLDLETGQSEVFLEDHILATSPGGQYLLTAEKVFGDRWLTYLSSADGSNRWLLADDDLWFISPTWSADGEWLLAGVSDTTYEAATGALVHPRTCQVISLPRIQGSILSWSK